MDAGLSFQGILNHVESTPSPGKGGQSSFNSRSSGFGDARPGKYCQNKSPYQAFSGQSNLPIDDFRMAVMKGDIQMVRHYLNDGR
jgi:hypothetical protein